MPYDNLQPRESQLDFEYDQKPPKLRARNLDGCDIVRRRTTSYDSPPMAPDGPRTPEIHPSQVVVGRLKAGVTKALGSQQ